MILFRKGERSRQTGQHKKKTYDRANGYVQSGGLARRFSEVSHAVRGAVELRLSSEVAWRIVLERLS